MMHRNKNKAGFTLIELMIVVAIIAIIASVAIPKLMAARLAANESAAISTLRSLSSAQAQVQSSGAIDSDGDGAGEYGFFGELSGADPCRVSAAGVPAGGVVGTDELNPPVLSAAFGNVDANAQVSRSGYIFQMYLPDATVAGVTGSVAEDANGGKAAAPFPDPNNCETMWACYAWPVAAGQSGIRCFFINQEGDILQTPNRGAAAYTATGGGPVFDAAFSVGGDMASPLGVNAAGGAVDGNVWTAVQ